MKTDKKTKALLPVSGAVTAVICVIMNFALIPMIEASTNGIRCFDMQSLGYSFDTAKQFLSLLSEESRNIYLHVQLPLDFIYPVAYTAFFMTALKALSCKKLPLVVPGALALFDYAENVCSVVMLKSMDVSEGLAKFASFATVTKSLLMTLTFALLIVFLFIRASQKARKKKNNE